MGECILDAPVQRTVDGSSNFRAKGPPDGDAAEGNRAARSLLPPGAEVADQVETFFAVGKASFVDQDAQVPGVAMRRFGRESTSMSPARHTSSGPQSQPRAEPEASIS